MILLTGAAGKTGRAVLRQLSKSDLDVKALVFRHEQKPEIEALGAREVVIGDLTNEENTRNACKDVEAIYFICPNIHPEESLIGKKIIKIAVDSGIRHFVYHSVLHPQTETMTHHWQKMRVEETLFNSRIPFTILQPTVYMQNILANWNQIITSGKYQIPYSTDSRISYVDLEDVAQAVAVILRDSLETAWKSNHTGAVYELVGTHGISHTEIAATLSLKLHQPVRVEKISIESWKAEASQAGLDEYRLDTLVRMFHYYDQNGMVGNSNILRMLLNRNPTSYETFIDRTLNANLN